MSTTTQDHHPARVPDTTICLKCGYSLRGLPEDVCPECGREFDPADPRTWRIPDLRGRWRHEVLRCSGPPGWLDLLVLALVTGVLVFACQAWHDLEPWRQALMTGETLVLFGLIYAVRLYACRLGRTLTPVFLVTTGRHRTRWLIPPVCLMLLSASLVAACIPPLQPACDPRLWVSMPFLYAKSARVRSSNTAAEYGQWVGLLYFRRILLTYDGRVRFEAFHDQSLVHDPDRAGPQQQVYVFPWSNDWCLKDWCDSP